LNRSPRGNNSKKFKEKTVSKTEDAFDVPAFINSRPIGAVQYGIVVLCGLVMFMDGLDTQAKFGPFPAAVPPLR
jgi:hypothetical protein